MFREGRLAYLLGLCKHCTASTPFLTLLPSTSQAAVSLLHLIVTSIHRVPAALPTLYTLPGKLIPVLGYALSFIAQ